MFESIYPPEARTRSVPKPKRKSHHDVSSIVTSHSMVPVSMCTSVSDSAAVQLMLVGYAINYSFI
jgi:hypothetical protein